MESKRWYQRKSDPNIPFIFYIQRKLASAECFFRDIFACILYFQKYYQHCHSHSLSGIARVLLLIRICIKAYFTPVESFLQPFFLLIFSLAIFFSCQFFLFPIFPRPTILSPPCCPRRASTRGLESSCCLSPVFRDCGWCVQIISLCSVRFGLCHQFV